MVYSVSDRVTEVAGRVDLPSRPLLTVHCLPSCPIAPCCLPVCPVSPSLTPCLEYRTMTKTKRCNQCQQLRINGVVCHETGCPNAWKVRRECKWCPRVYVPRERWMDCCSLSCYRAYHGK